MVAVAERQAGAAAAEQLVKVTMEARQRRAASGVVRGRPALRAALGRPAALADHRSLTPWAVAFQVLPARRPPTVDREVRVMTTHLGLVGLTAARAL